MRPMAWVILLALLVPTTAVAAEKEEDGGWEEYTSKEYGFSMKCPKGTKFTEKEKSGGWGGLYAKHDGVELYALAKLGTFATAKEIQKFAVKESGIATKLYVIHGAPGVFWQKILVFNPPNRLAVIFVVCLNLEKNLSNQVHVAFHRSVPKVCDGGHQSVTSQVSSQPHCQP